MVCSSPLLLCSPIVVLAEPDSLGVGGELQVLALFSSSEGFLAATTALHQQYDLRTKRGAKRPAQFWRKVAAWKLRLPRIFRLISVFLRRRYLVVGIEQRFDCCRRAGPRSEVEKLQSCCVAKQTGQNGLA